jgi:N utilization substance protein B
MSAPAKRETAPPREARHRAREAAIQMLYQWEVGRVPMFEVAQTYWQHGSWPETAGAPAAGEEIGAEVRDFATVLANGVAASVQEVDQLIAEAAEHWRIERMAVIDRLILRLAVYEFLHEKETPAKVIINEALELARTFSTDDAVKFINGILDGIRRTLERE